MKHRAVAFIAACAVTLVASCASAPRAVPASAAADRPLTIELFDSRALTAVPAPRGAAPPRMSLPAPPEDGASAAVAGIAETLAAASSSPAASPAPFPLPAAPDALAGLDASLRAPSRPSVKASFRMAAPAVPSAAVPPARQSASVAPASRQAPAKLAPGRPAPAKQAAAGGTLGGTPSTPAAPSSSPSTPTASPPSTTPSPSTAPSPSVGSSASASPYGRLREIYARQGDELQIGLDGVGFLFLGLPDAQVDGMSFKSKENRANKTLFTFQALKLGTYDLDFLQQDNMAGKTSRETVRVHVVSDQDFATATAGQQDPQVQGPAGAGPSQESGDPAFAQKLAAAGSYSAAVAELLKGYKEGDPGLNDQIASIYLRMGSYDAAEKYWSRNLAPQTDFTQRAVVGLFRVSLLQDDQQGLLTYLRPFLALNDSAMEEPLIQAVRMEKGRAEIGLALDLAAEYVRRFPNGTWRDEADLLTAQLLEADSRFRDLARARQLYLVILSDHPESPFADTARRRVQYIDRHFYDVR